MLSPNKFDHIYFFRPYIDFRKGHRGLAGIVQDEMKLNPFEKYLSAKQEDTLYRNPACCFAFYRSQNLLTIQTSNCANWKQ